MALDREFDPPAGSDAQRCFDLSLETLQCSTHAWLLLVQGTGCGAYPATPGNFMKYLEQVPVDVPSKNDTQVNRQVRFAHWLAPLVRWLCTRHLPAVQMCK